MNTKTRPFLCSLTLLFLLLFLSCKRNVTKIDSNYIGDWAEQGFGGNGACHFVLTISQSGSGTYESPTSSDCKNLHTYSGTAKTDGKTLQIGLMHWNINQKPTSIAPTKVRTELGEFVSVMQMQLGEQVFFKRP